MIEGGTFCMGLASSSLIEARNRHGVSFPGSFEDEAPAHVVTLSSFRLDRYPVTNEQFASFVADRPEWGPDQLASSMHNGRYLAHWLNGTCPAALNDHPVVFVTWHAAQAYCRWAGGRLPTEAEWEYAARAGDDREFPWGDDLPTPVRANYGSSGLGTTTAVGSYPPNPLGLFDMAGNVWEWVLDEWQSDRPEPGTNPIASGEVTDAMLRDVLGRRAIRGGSFAGAVVNLRTRWRDSHVVTNAAEFVGFRCAYPIGAT